MSDKSNQPSKPSEKKARDKKFYGRAACEALFTLRKEDIIRAYIADSVVKKYGDVMKWCAQNKKAYHVVTTPNLEIVAETGHHEGICFVAKERPFFSLLDLFTDVKNTKKPMCLLMLDGVQNPHNLGAIIRSAAHFGVSHIIATEAAIPGIAGGLARVAEGGVEFVKVVRCGELSTAVGPLKKLGFQFLATHVQSGKSVFEIELTTRVVFCIGSENSGISKGLMEKCDSVANIPGTGCIDSLNVATASAVFMSEFLRQNSKAAK